MFKYVNILIVLCFAVSCNNSEIKKVNQDHHSGVITKNTGIKEPTYAKGFFFDKNTLVIRSVSDTSKTIARIPINREQLMKTVAVTSATHVAMVHKLGVIDSIIAVSYISYIRNPQIQTNFKLGKLKEIPSQLNEGVETLLELNPSYVIVSPEQYNNASKAKKLGLNLIPNLDYLETSPLARAEWIKVFGYLFNLDAKADSVFKAIESEYLKIRTQDVASKTIFSGKPYQGTWFVPGGQSYKAQMFEDARISYVFANNKGSGSFQVDFETVLDTAIDADYWEFVVYSDSLTYESLTSENPLFPNFKAFQSKKIIYCNTKKVDLYGTGILEPHIVLQDLKYAIDSNYNSNYTPKYYHLLK